jgi:hypothetical protein
VAIASITQLTDDLDDRALFDAAIAPDPAPEPEPSQDASSTPADPASPPGPRRDELGRFASTAVTPPETIEAAPDPALAEGAGAAPAEGDLVPSWRLREEREAREAYASRLAERDRQLTDALNYLRQMQAQAAPPPQPVDPIGDLPGFHQSLAGQLEQLRNELSGQIRTQQLESNLQLTRLQAGPELFDNAYRAFVETASGDQGFARAIVASPNPGAALVNWYRQALTLNQIGPDPESWFAERKQALLQDPEFLQQAVEAARNYQPGAARASGQMRPGGAAAGNNVTVLPPSLMRMRGSSTSEATAANPGGDDPLSDNSLFAFATKQR